MVTCLFALQSQRPTLEVSIALVGKDAFPNAVGIRVTDLPQIKPEHKKVLEFALHEPSIKNAFAKGERICKLEIPSKIAPAFFEKAALQSMLTFEGKKVFFDPFVFWDLEIEVLQDDASLLLEIYFKLGSYRIPYKEISWFSFDRRGWVLYRDTLRSLNPNYDPKWIKKLLSLGPSCSLNEKAFFLDLDEESPKVLTVFEDKKEPLREAVLLDLFGMELSFPGALTRELENELQDAGYDKKGESKYSLSSDKAFSALELLLLGGWILKDRTGKKIIPLTTCEAVATEESPSTLTIEPDLDFAGTKKKWKELQFEGPMLATLSKDALGLVLPSKLPSFLQDPKFRLKPTHPIRIPSHRFGELEGVCLPTAMQKLLGMTREENIHTQENGSGNGPGPKFLGNLFPYQQKGLLWLDSLRACRLHGLLADEMGLGKTVQVISFLSLPNSLPALIVVPASLTVQWKREIEKFLAEANVIIDEGDEPLHSSNSIYIVSFARVRKDKERYASKLWQSLIIDEAHAILNQKTQLFHAISTIQASFRLAITGTPLINRQSDFESLFAFLIPTLLEKGLEPTKIKRRTAPFILRRTQQEVFEELPEKIEEEVLLELTPYQQEWYETIQKKLGEGNLLASLKKGRMEVLEVILRLRQVCLHPSLIGPSLNGLEEEMDLEQSAKFSLLLIDLEEMIESKKKAIVCSSFAKALRLLLKLLPFPKQQILIIDGEASNRLDTVDAFETSQEGCILLLSLKAGGVGLNLPSADAFFLLDPWWNEAMEQQALYRALRLGRKKKLIVKKYIAMGTIEEKMQGLKKSKKLQEDLLLGESLELDEELLADLFAT